MEFEMSAFLVTSLFFSSYLLFWSLMLLMGPFLFKPQNPFVAKLQLDQHGTASMVEVSSDKADYLFLRPHCR
jgi:hypothetical protein